MLSLLLASGIDIGDMIKRHDLGTSFHTQFSKLKKMEQQTEPKHSSGNSLRGNLLTEKSNCH